MSLELHAETRRDLMPDPEVDPILAVFYNILNDVTTDAQQRDITGVILVDKKSKEIQSAIKNRKKSTQPDPPSPQPSTSRDTGSEVKPSPQPSTSRPLSPQPSTSRAPTQRGKRPRSVSPTPSPGAKVPRGEAEHTLLQKSGVDDLDVVYVENEEELFMEVLKLFSRYGNILEVLSAFKTILTRQKIFWISSHCLIVIPLLRRGGGYTVESLNFVGANFREYFNLTGSWGSFVQSLIQTKDNMILFY